MNGFLGRQQLALGLPGLDLRADALGLPLGLQLDQLGFRRREIGLGLVLGFLAGFFFRSVECAWVNDMESPGLSPSTLRSADRFKLLVGPIAD